MAKAKVASQLYIWEGKDGAGKRVKGEISGQSEALVRAILRRQKINPTKVKKNQNLFSDLVNQKLKPKIFVFGAVS